MALNKGKKAALALAAVVLIAVVVGVLVWRGSRQEQDPAPQQQPAQTPASEQTGVAGIYQEEYYTDDGQTLLMTAQWEVPGFQGQVDDAVAEKIDQYYQARQQQRLEELEQLRLQAQEQQRTLAGFLPYSVEEMYEVTRQDGAVVSVLRTALEYLGGSNAQSVWQADNFDGQTGETLTLDDLLTDQPDSRQRLFDLVEEEIAQQRAQGAAFYDGAETLAREIHQPDRFYLTQGALVLFYPVYDLAPFTEGPVYLSLSYDRLDGIIKEEYCLT